MPIVEIAQEDRVYSILPAGTYGPGMSDVEGGFEADVTVNRFEYEATGKNLPGWHKEGDNRKYSFFEFTVRLPDGGGFFTLSAHVERGPGKPKLFRWMEALGAMTAEDVGFDPDDIAGRKVTGLVIKQGNPHPDGGFYQGNVTQIIG
jgi:hypothetical protein